MAFVNYELSQNFYTINKALLITLKVKIIDNKRFVN